MKINLILDENNVIISFISYPLDKKKITVEVDDPSSIHLGYDKYIEGEIVKDDVSFSLAKAKEEKIERIHFLKKKLNETDYKLFKFLEGQISEEEYLKVKEERQSYRDEINALENEL